MNEANVMLDYVSGIGIPNSRRILKNWKGLQWKAAKVLWGPGHITAKEQLKGEVRGSPGSHLKLLKSNCKDEDLCNSSW